MNTKISVRSLLISFLFCFMFSSVYPDVAKKSSNETVYDKRLVHLFELIYGYGFLSLGGTDAIDRMMAGVDLTGKRLLDIGSGLGGVEFYLAKNNSLDIMGLDLEPWLVKEAQRRYEEIKDQLQGSVEFVIEHAGDYLQQFENESFDIVFSKAVLLHIPLQDKVTYFKQIHRVLKKGGCIIILDWMHTSPHYSDTVQEMFDKSSISYNLVTPPEYFTNLQAAGFSSITFVDNSSQRIILLKESHKKIVEMKEEIKQHFGNTTYERFIDGSEIYAFENKELVTGTFRAKK